MKKNTPKSKNKNQPFSRFLTVDVKKLQLEKNLTSTPCEVIAYGMEEKLKSILLKKDYSTHKEVLSDLQKLSELSTSTGGGTMIRFGGKLTGSHALFINLGKDKEGVNALGKSERMRRLGSAVASKLMAEKIKSADIYLESFQSKDADLNLDDETAAYTFIEGLALTCYKFTKYFTSESASKVEQLHINLISTGKSSQGFASGIDRAKALVHGIEICRDLGNEPSNHLYPEAYAQRAKEIAEGHGLKITILNDKDCAKEKMGLLLGVGQGSVNPSRLVMIEYKPNNAKKSLAIVGKGVTFDSGGISIKPSARMEEMKHDMCGSAAAVGAIISASMLKVKTQITAVLALAENMPDGNAIQPGNILKARSGKTVEVINTDAEGRLVLADALDYIQDKEPDYIIDLATLTGAATVTFGRACAGVMGNDEKFNTMVKTAAKNSGERVWELPLFEEYFDDLKSEYADMRNSGDTPANGTAKGAMFLLQFIRKGTKWAHLDIASVANGVSNVPYYPKKSTTGYGVRLLVELAESLQ